MMLLFQKGNPPTLQIPTYLEALNASFKAQSACTQQQIFCQTFFVPKKIFFPKVIAKHLFP